MTARQQLDRTRGVLLEKMMAMIAAAENKNRALSDSEEAEWRRLHFAFKSGESPAVTAEAKRSFCERWNKYLSEISDPIVPLLATRETWEAERPRGGGGRYGGTGGRHAESLFEPEENEGTYWQDRATGEKIRVYASHERMADARQKPDYDFGSFIRGLLLGPKNDIEAAAMQEGSIGSGGAMVPEILTLQLIDALRAQSACTALGMATIPLGSRIVDIARIVRDPVPGWRDELAPLKQTDVSFDRLTFVAKSCAWVCTASRELVEDAQNFSAELTSLFARVGAHEIDRVALAGIGSTSPSDEPVGLLSMAGVNEIDCGGSPGQFTDFDPLIDGLGEILRANGPMPTGIALSPEVLIRAAKFKDSLRRQLPWPEDLAGLPRKSTTALSSGTSPDYDGSLILGFWPWLYLGLRTSIQIRPLREVYAASSGSIGFEAWMRLDIQSPHPVAFTRLVNIG